MCFFPTAADPSSVAFKKGVTAFNCGSCPECLKTRASAWALRATYEARAHKSSYMVTLTYDSYIRDSRGRIIGEHVADRHVDVTDCQKFIKRLRKKFGKGIKYLIAAEYGKRTHRPHYHALLFGVKFDDVRYYKRSKRGNPIFKSETLSRLWGHGICTIDKQNVTQAAARYCTKYLAKDKGAEDTFQLFSQGLGIAELEKDFNGLYYVMDGRYYPIPRLVWRRRIERKYGVSFRYVNRLPDGSNLVEYTMAKNARDFAAAVRDGDVEYIDYLEYWKKRSEDIQQFQLPVCDRIALLPDSRYFMYKQKALFALNKRRFGIPWPAPRSKQRSAIVRYYFSRHQYWFDVEKVDFNSCRCPSRLATASDTIEIADQKNIRLQREIDCIKAAAVPATIADLQIFDS